ncbi:MAG: S-layer homology domain-containing protein [Clostridia bacterium]|nr:S-layer homology domain-containing protein [Clostridia bacterium]
MISHNHANDTEVTNFGGERRPASTLTVTNNIFYNASAVNTGIIHYEFVNMKTVVDIQDNYFYCQDGGSVLAPEFVVDSAQSDQSNCMVIKNNRLFGAYKIPNLKGSNNATYIDMSDNFFGTNAGKPVYTPVFMGTTDQRLIRTSFFVDPEMQHKNGFLSLNVENWSLAWVNNEAYTVEMIVYTEGGSDSAVPAVFTAGEGTEVKLYKKATTNGDGIITGVSNKVNAIDASVLGDDIYAPTTLYAQIENEVYPDFAPVYKVTIQNIGNLDDAEEFSEAYPDYMMYTPAVSESTKGEMVPYRWQGNIYKLYVGKNIFGSVGAAIKYANSIGNEIPTIVVPAGIYTDEMVITGSCTILGEKHGINPNKKSYDILTQDIMGNSAWSLNPARSNSALESTFNACIRVDKSADDFIITVDGIKMGPGCSYVDDEKRSGDNVTIFKNVYAHNAGGGLDRTGAGNNQLFRFWKAFESSGFDMCTMYMYDTRVDALSALNTCFGPYFEKFVLDGVFFGNAINNTRFMASFRSRDIANPYYSITNSYLYNNNNKNAGQSSFYMIDTSDDSGTLTAKTNIVYNFDNNVFYNAFATGYGAMQIKFTGNNMTFYLTNTTLADDSNTDTFIACTSGSSRWVGTCPTEDCSDILVVKGCRLICENRLPMTNGTGKGTMIDFSGNYYAANISQKTGHMPDKARRLGVTPTSTGNWTYEECSRVSVDYTFLDWDMTIRSDDDALSAAEYEFTTGMFGTGTYKDEVVSGSTKPVYRDVVPVDCAVYSIPVLKGEYTNLAFYTDPGRTEISQVKQLKITDTENTFYGVASSFDGSDEKDFVIVLTRQSGTEAVIEGMNNFVVDNENKTIKGHVTGNSFSISSIELIASPGVTLEWYKDAGLTDEETKTSFSTRTAKDYVYYIKAISQDGNKSNVYEFTLTKVKAADINTISIAEIVGIEDAKKINATTYEMNLDSTADTISVVAKIYTGATLKMFNGSTEITGTTDDWVSTFAVPNNGVRTLKLIVTSGDGNTSKEYTLNLVAGSSATAEVLDIEGAYNRGSHWTMNIGLAEAFEPKVTVSSGCSYDVFYDYNCTTPIENGVAIIEDSSQNLYIKATTADGLSSSITKLTVTTDGHHRELPTVTVKVGDKEYTGLVTGKKEISVYLPAGVKTAKLSAKTLATTGGECTFYADPAKMMIVGNDVDIQLKSKVSTYRLMTSVGSYSVTLEDGTADSFAVMARDLVVKIISDRDVVTYKDDAKIYGWTRPYVEYLNKNNFGIFAGDTNGNINIGNNITRYEIATLAVRIMGLDLDRFDSANLTFADSIADWAKPYVRAAVASGLINGSLDVATNKLYFNGDGYATREQVMKIFVSVCMAQEGIVFDGTTTTFDSYYAAHKTEYETIFNSYEFVDADKISGWAKPYVVYAVARYNLVGGSDEGGRLFINPANNITRAEVAKMIACYMGY